MCQQAKVYQCLRGTLPKVELKSMLSIQAASKDSARHHCKNLVSHMIIIHLEPKAK
jgi:hypothetical protein